ncbi:hypothetical protein [Sphingobacterium kitahiroshimense]|uniref:DUF4062 domain-containing protein n=1 Tax=Sphingobacterium kitahiroshimense TaxID=470446 RepID=A0ABV0BWW3_9SPHI
MKFKVFISSRNNDKIIIGKSNDQTLTDIRIWIKEELEKEELLDKNILDISINESFNRDTTHDSYYACLDEVHQSDFTIVLYNGASGWAPPGFDIGICHAEFAESIQISTKKTSIVDIRNFCPVSTTDEQELKRNKLFSDEIQLVNRFTNPIKITGAQTLENFKNTLLKEIKNTIHKHILDRIKVSNIYYDLAGNTKTILDWKKLKYSDRNNRIKETLQELISTSTNFRDTINIPNAIPDNMSVEDAKSFTGRPFLVDQDKILDIAPGKLGPIHFIAVYGNATEIQVKNLIGYPDVSVIKDEFGIYVWEQNSHIQMIFLTDCKTHNAVKSNFLLFNNWASSSGELNKIQTRAKARLHILKAINEAKNIANDQ